MTLARIVSGGQTGVDRAALDVARELGIAAGGWCPKGRLAEDGQIPLEYLVRETPSAAYAQRTRWNVRDSDATLVLTWGAPSGGTALTIRLAEQLGRPRVVVDLQASPEATEVRRQLADLGVKVLNVAGPRESGAPGVYARACEFLRRLLGD